MQAMLGMQKLDIGALRTAAAGSSSDSASSGPPGPTLPRHATHRRMNAAMTFTLLTGAMQHGRMGEYQLQAATVAVHDQAPTYEYTDLAQLVGIYQVLDRIAPNPM